VAFSSRYQSGTCQPASRATSSIRSRLGAAADVGVNGGEEGATGAGDAGQLGETGGRVGEVVKDEGGDGIVDGVDREGQGANVGGGARRA
jgi:hypothetical protein